MPLDSTLLTLAHWMAGEFDNREQAIADPTWFVHLRMWQRPVPLFREDSLTLFAEQANVINPDQPYRQRLIRLVQTDDLEAPLQAQYYAFKDPAAVKGAGLQPQTLSAIAVEQIEFLPGCRLKISHRPGREYIMGAPMLGRHCFFSYQGKRSQVQLGFSASANTFQSHDKGIDTETQKATWGAVMGPYLYTKRQDFAAEWAIDREGCIDHTQDKML